MSLSIEWSGNNIIVKITGTLTFTDIMNASNCVYGDPRFDEMRYQLIDMRELQNFEVSRDDLKIFSAIDSRSCYWNNDLKIAYLTDNQSFVDIINIYRKYMEDTNWEISIFDSMDAALDWCGSLKKVDVNG